MTSSRYQAAVSETALALARGEEADWLAARNTYEHTRRGRNGGRPTGDDGKVSMERWCADVQDKSSVRLRFGPATGSRYARIWQMHGLNNSSPATSFKEAYREVDGTPDRERMMEYEGTRLLEKGTPEQKVEQAAALLRDPEVRQVARDVSTPLGGAIYGVAEEAKTQRQHEGDALDRVRDARTQTDPVLKGLDESQAIGDLTKACFDFARAVAALLPRIDHLPAADNDPLLARHFLREANVRAKSATEQVDDLLRTGKVGGGVDAFLKSVLEGGDKGK